MTLKGVVEIEAYTSEKKLVLRQVFPLHEWYEQSHPIVDSDDERARLRVSSMQGKQYDDNGDLEQYWSNTYAESGAIMGMRVWRKDGSRQDFHFQS
jgi:hypothetical protein